MFWRMTNSDVRYDGVRRPDMSNATSAVPELIAERKARRLLRFTLFIGILLIAIGFAVAVYRLRREAFNKVEWDQGKGVLTSANPRLRMQRDVEARLRHGMTRAQVISMLGPPDPVFAVKYSTGGTSQPYQPLGSLAYKLGVSPGRMMSPPMLMTLVVNFGPADTVQYPAVDGVPYSKGDKIIPAKPMPAPSHGSPMPVIIKSGSTLPKASPSKAKSKGP
jgi:hypothetical protein